MGLYASKAKKKEKEINKALGKTMVYSKKGVSSGTPSYNTPKQTLPKASETTVLPTVTKQPETKLSLMDRVKIANEKVSRVYAQNAADMQYKKTKAKTIGPAVWNGGNTTLSALPKARLRDKIDVANANASNAYAQKASDMYGVKQKKTSVLPKANVNDVAYSEPYKLDTGNNDRLSYISNAWLNKTLETPATPTKAKQGTSVFDRIYNALASIGDSSIGSDLSLKSAFKQSATNEKDYKAMLKQYDGLITELILERDKLSPKSNEYIQYNKLIDQVYDMANAVRDRTADMTEANKFLQNAGKLQEKATEGMGTVGKNVTEAAISVADNLTKMALTGFNPTATLVAMGVGAAGQRANELSNSGVAANDALGRGIVSGVIEGLTEKIGVDNLYALVKSNNVKVLADILKQAAAEGTEEGLGSVLNYAADRMAGDNEKFDWNDMAQSVIQGALSGAMFGIGGVATNKAFDAIDNYNANHIQYNDVIPKGNNNYSSDISDINLIINNQNANEYLNNYLNSRNYVTDLVTKEAPLALPAPKFYATSEGINTGIPKENTDSSNTYTVIDNAGTENYSKSDGRMIKSYNFLNQKAEEANKHVSAVYDAYKEYRTKVYDDAVNEVYNVYKHYEPTSIISDLKETGLGKLGKNLNAELTSILDKAIKKGANPDDVILDIMTAIANSNEATKIMGDIDVSKDLREYIKNRIRYSPTYAVEFGDDWKNINRALGFTVKKGGADIMEVLAECNERFGTNFDLNQSNENALYELYEVIKKGNKQYTAFDMPAELWEAVEKSVKNNLPEKGSMNYEIYQKYGLNPTEKQIRQIARQWVDTEIKNSKFGNNSTFSQINAIDTVLSDYDKITGNGTRNILNINQTDSGYAVEYGDKRQAIKIDNTKFYNGKQVLEERAVKNGDILPTAEANIRNKGNKNTRKKSKFNGQSEYMKQIYDVMTGNFDDKNVVGLGKTPDILQKYGAKNIEMTMKPSAVRKIAYPTNYLGLKQGHNLGFYALEQLPQQLANPVAIAKSKMPNSLIVFTEFLDADNSPVIAAIHLDKNGNIGVSNEVASVYGKRTFDNMVSDLRNSGKMLYEDKNRGLASLPAYGLQLSEVEATTDPIFNIYNSAQNVNIDSLSNNDVLPTATDTNSNNNLGIVNQDAQQLFEDLQNAKTDVRSKARRAYQSTISGWAPFERMTKADTRRNGRNITGLVNKLSQKNGVFDTIKKKALFDINANKVSDLSLDSVVKQVPTNQLNDFNTYWHELHNIDRLAQNKPVTEHTADESRQIVAQLEAQHPEFKTYKQNISNYLDLFMRTWLVDTGLITQENYNQMRNMYPNYIPTYRVMEKAGNGSTSYREGRRLRNRNPIGKAKGGTSEVLSFDEAMAYKMSSVVNAAIKNDISREVYSFAQAQPTEAAKNGILIKQNGANANTAIDIDSFTDELEKNIARETSRGNYEITFYDNGKPQTMKISKDVWEAYNFLDDKLAGSGYRMMAELGKKITSPMKAATTGYNPLFALTNPIRDAQTYAINNSAKNGAQAAKNYVKALKEVLTGSDTYDQYKALGGSQNGYYGSETYNRMYKDMRNGKDGVSKVRDVLRKPFDAIASLGEFTEILPRYAEYLNTIENLGNTDAGRLQASLNAADVTVNFGRTAQLSALANAWVPYFNAGLQGADRTLRQIKAHPIKTTARATASVFLPTLLVYLINKDNPHWEDVKDGVKDNYYLLPNYAGAIDIYGYPETFIRIPKSREFGALFSASFERFIRALDESESDNKSLKETLPTAFDGYSDTLVNSFAPPDILGDNILGSMRRLGTNTAWHGGKIIPSNLTDVSPEYQYDINTSGIAKGIANKTNKVPFLPDWAKSPIALDYIIDSYGGYAGDVLQGLTSGKNKGATENETLKNSLYSGFVQPFKNRFTTDSAYSNYNLDRFYDRKEEITKAANDRDIRENLPSDYRTPEEKLESDFTSAQKQISDLTKQEKEILNSNASIAEKNKKIRKLKQQKNNIAKEMLKNQDKLYKEYAANYIPEISGLSDSRQEDAKELNKKYNLSYSDFMKIYEGYSDINKKDEKPTMKATEFDEYLNSLGYTSNKEITSDIRDRFVYFNSSPADSYYDQSGYQKVQSFMNVNTYASIKDVLGNVSYPGGVKGAKSMAYKRAIDDFMQQHGYNPSYDERMKIYEACGVGKTYRY